MSIKKYVSNWLVLLSIFPQPPLKHTVAEGSPCCETALVALSLSENCPRKGNPFLAVHLGISQTLSMGKRHISQTLGKIFCSTRFPPISQDVPLLFMYFLHLRIISVALLGGIPVPQFPERKQLFTPFLGTSLSFCAKCHAKPIWWSKELTLESSCVGG